MILVVFCYVFSILLHLYFGGMSRIYRGLYQLSRDLDRTLADFCSFLVIFHLISNMAIGSFGHLHPNFPSCWA